MADAHPSAPPEGYVKPSWDYVYVEMMEALRLKASCKRARFAAIVVDPFNRVVSMGVNGAPYGQPECLEVGCLLVDGHCVRTIHCEANAMAGKDVRGCVLYVTGEPCIACANSIIQNGIAVVKYEPGQYTNGNNLAAQLLGIAKVKVVRLDKKERLNASQSYPRTWDRPSRQDTLDQLHEASGSVYNRTDARARPSCPPIR